MNQHAVLTTNQFIQRAELRRQEELERKEGLADPEYRKDLRLRLLAEILIDDDAAVIIEVEFDGYGDRGNVHSFVLPNNEDGSLQKLEDELNQFISDLVDTHVTWDWYNNEGGGGSVEWNLSSDKITINGYYNQIEQIDQAEVEL